ncbi:MAG: AGE family epimerase/isomerase [Rhodothermales bacterium]
MIRERIGRHDVKALRDHYRRYLFEEYLPFWYRYGIDHELGGFMCAIDHDGARVSDEKNVWFQGRGLWTYSYLYRHFGGDEHLEVARKARDFLLRHGRDRRGDWVQSLSRTGAVTSKGKPQGNETLFVAEGMLAFALATGDQESMDVAKDALWRAADLFDKPRRHVEESYIPRSYRGHRTLGSHMVLLLVLTQMLEQVDDERLEALAGRVVDAIVVKFWNSKYGLMNEVLAHDYSRPADDNEPFIYLGHAIETLSMLLCEALRRGDQALFDLAAERFRRHLEVAWDEEYGGFLRALSLPKTYKYDKVLWVQEEVLVGCMMLLEHTDWDWPAFWFERTFDYVEKKFSLRKHGLPLYLYNGDRQVSFVEHVRRKENYHHPRRVMRNLLALERMLD